MVSDAGKGECILETKFFSKKLGFFPIVKLSSDWQIRIPPDCPIPKIHMLSSSSGSLSFPKKTGNAVCQKSGKFYERKFLFRCLW